MQVNLNLVGILRDYYPATPDCTAGPVSFECAPGTTVRALLEHAGVPEVEDYFIMLNGERVMLAAAAERELQSGDAVTLVAVIKGG